MKLFNTLSRKKEDFIPINKGHVSMYCCGPTVYNYAHIGNLRTFIFEDFLYKTLKLSGYNINYVMNITDVGHLTSDSDSGDDKMKKGALREKKTVWEIAKFYEDAFLSDMEALNMAKPNAMPRATEHIDEMIDNIKKLQENGYAYVGGNGNLYFDTQKFKDYGVLANLQNQDLQAGSRVEVDPNKKHPFDFVLWFVTSKHGEQDMQWDSPFGRGFPGWHIECTAMSSKYLGNNFDIHCGGIDHIPVHHTNEIAQAECAFDCGRWVNYWLHASFLVLKDKEKMAKSSGNFLRLQTLIDKGYTPLDYRYFCMQTHYRKDLVFSFDALSAAKTGFRRLKDAVLRLGDEVGNIDDLYMGKFKDAISDDINMPVALATVWDLVGDKNVDNANKKATLIEFEKVLSLDLFVEDLKVIEIPKEVLLIVEERDNARVHKDYALSDQLRDKLFEMGYKVLDGKDGGRVEKI